jgi:multicomponent Na+:H+ antiporter subunit F
VSGPPAAEVALAVMAAALLVALVRLLRGPSLADRVVALDLLGTVAIGMIAAVAVVAEAAEFLDVALVVALVMFLGTVAFARYLEQGEK